MCRSRITDSRPGQGLPIAFARSAIEPMNMPQTTFHTPSSSLSNAVRQAPPATADRQLAYIGLGAQENQGGLAAHATPSRPPLSAAIICHNELHNIRRCLAALDFCDEIVVVDSGSTDGTRQLLEADGRVRLLTRPFDTFINQKNFALDACQHDWVLSVDADEVITPELGREIAALDFAVAGYQIGRRTFLGDQEIRHGAWAPDYNLRLFHRGHGRWGGSNPHERVVLDAPAARLRHRMLHYSYRNREEFLARNEKYTRMIVAYAAERGHRSYLGEPLVHAVGNFVKVYLLKQGFRDGAAGWFIAWHTARLSRLKYTLLARQGGPESTGKPSCPVHVSSPMISVPGRRPTRSTLPNH